MTAFQSYKRLLNCSSLKAGFTSDISISKSEAQGKRTDWGKKTCSFFFVLTCVHAAFIFVTGALMVLS